MARNYPYQFRRIRLVINTFHFWAGQAPLQKPSKRAVTQSDKFESLIGARVVRNPKYNLGGNQSQSGDGPPTGPCRGDGRHRRIARADGVPLFRDQRLFVPLRHWLHAPIHVEQWTDYRVMRHALRRQRLVRLLELPAEPFIPCTLPEMRPEPAQWRRAQ